MNAPSASASDHAFVLLGALYCARTPTVLTTVLGSCVSICLWDRIRCAGGMNHFLLPTSRNGERSPRFGDVATERLIQGMLQLGCEASDLRAKVFGGAAVLPVGEAEACVGEQNVAAAFEHLAQRGIPVVTHRTGGRSGLVVRLHTHSGDVELRPVGARLGAGWAGR
jgi:chemotaxis protein CheD